MDTRKRIYKFLSTERWNDSAIFFMRIFAGVLMLIHGIGKINNYEMLFTTFPDPLGIGSEASLVLIIGAETICSLLLIVGLFVRPAALILAVGMFVASFLAVPGEPFAGTRAFVRLYGNIRDAGHQRRYALFARQGLFQGTVERGGHGELRT